MFNIYKYSLPSPLRNEMEEEEGCGDGGRIYNVPSFVGHLASMSVVSLGRCGSWYRVVFI